MSTYMKAFLETEITIIPQLMDGFIGKYYNNALYNAITWIILILHIIHFLFDVCVNALLKKMRFKEYIRIRLKRSLWYLGFYGCSFMYCSATMWKNNIRLPQRYKFHVLDLTEPVSGHLLLGYALLSAFYASSFMWEGLQCSISSFTYLFLTAFVAFTYFLRYIELAILLASTFSVIHVMIELTRCLYCIIKGDLGLPKLFIKITFFITIITFAVTYSIIIPTSFVLPLGRGFLKNSNSIIMAALNISLWGWLGCEVYSSPLYRLILHRWAHTKNGNKVPECLGSDIECALFLPRDDVAYNLKIIKQEIKERQAKMIALRKPKKGASMLVQTLKCVAALNRKIKNRKLLEKTTPITMENESKIDEDSHLEEVVQTSFTYTDELLEPENSVAAKSILQPDSFAWEDDNDAENIMGDTNNKEIECDLIKDIEDTTDLDRSETENDESITEDDNVLNEESSEVVTF